jgi:hypothetical protein
MVKAKAAVVGIIVEIEVGFVDGEDLAGGGARVEQVSVGGEPDSLAAGGA